MFTLGSVAKKSQRGFCQFLILYQNEERLFGQLILPLTLICSFQAT